jgi:hypothetical protein
MTGESCSCRSNRHGYKDGYHILEVSWCAVVCFLYGGIVKMMFQTSFMQFVNERYLLKVNKSATVARA